MSVGRPRLADNAEIDRAPFQHRIIPAAGAPSVLPANAIVSPFAHPFQSSAGSADDAADPPAATTHEEKSLPQNKPAGHGRKPKPATKGSSARFQICALLLAKGDLSVEELKADVSADAKAFANAIYNAKGAGHILFVAKSDKWHITQEGKDWTSGGANPGQPQAGASAQPHRDETQGAGHPRNPRQKLRKPSAAASAAFADPARGTALAVRTFEPVVERSFRCAVFSDGAFHLAKNGQAIDLTASEFAEALRYVERMAEQPA